MFKFKGCRKNANVSECLVCALGPTFKYSLIFGMLCTNSTCPHRNKLVLEAEFKTSIFLLVYASFIAFVMLAAVTWYIYNFVTALNRHEGIPVELLSETLYIASGLCLAMNHILKCRARRSDLLAWSLLIRNRKTFGVQTMINSKSCRKIQARSAIFIFVSVAAMFAVSFFTLTRRYDEMYAWTTIRRPISTLAGFAQISTMWQFSTQGRVVLKMLESNHKSLKMFMQHYESYIKSCHCEVTSRDRGTMLFRRLEGCQRLHVAICQNLQFFSQMIRPNFLVWICFTLCCIIFNSYVFVATWFTIWEDGRFVVLLGFRTLMMCVTIVYLLCQIERLAAVSNDLLSFLYKYPISKLNTSEAVQLEMLITTLNIRKPILKASDVFTVGTRLLASVSGTIVTYVLVALQFHASWMKH